MALQSQLFRGDSKLEAATTSDPDHIVPGSRGEHVRKIQLALIKLDGATIDADGSYGPATAAAVLAYKQKRNIVNRSYQTQADNIVGKMTMASLDSEMLNQEIVPRGPVRIKPTSFARPLPQRSQSLVTLLNNSQPFGVNGSPISFGVGAPRIIPGPNLGPNVVIEMRKNSRGSFVVENGTPGEVVIGDAAIARFSRDGVGLPLVDRAQVLNDAEPFRLFSGNTLGRTTITATSAGSTSSIDVVVTAFSSPPIFRPGINHGHRPSGRYADVQANPNNAPTLIGKLLAVACPNLSPEGMANLAKRTFLADKPIALRHLDFYLTLGNGADLMRTQI